MAKCQDTEVYEVKSRQVSHLILLCLLKKKWCPGTKHLKKCVKST